MKAQELASKQGNKRNFQGTSGMGIHIGRTGVQALAKGAGADRLHAPGSKPSIKQKSEKGQLDPGGHFREESLASGQQVGSLTSGKAQRNPPLKAK